MERSFARSNWHPIDVSGFWRNYDFDEPEHEGDKLANIRSFFELVNRHMGRWRHITLELVRDIPLGPTGGPAPLLESLEVYEGVNSYDVDELISLFPRAWTPHLREVSIHGLKLAQLDMPFPPTLSKLIITDVNQSYWTPSFSKLLTILMVCPGLTTLELSSHYYRDDDSVKDESWTSFPVVELPALRELTLWKFGKRVIRAILQRLQFPHECVVRLSTWLYDTDPSANLTSTLAHHFGDVQNGGIDQITVAIERYSFVLRAQGPRWNMELEMGGFRGARDIVLLFNPGTTCAEGLPRDRIPVTLEFGRAGLSDEMLGRLDSLSELGCVTSLKVDVRTSLFFLTWLGLL